MAVLASDRDDDWREYERTGKFLIFIWRKINENKFRLRLPRLYGGKTQRKGLGGAGARFGVMRRRHLFT